MANFRPQAIAPVELDLDQTLLDALARGGIPVPPYPAVALRIQEVVNRKSFGLADVTRIVSADAALTADVLRCANSAMFGRGAHATTLAQAITRIGAREVMRLALSSGLAAHAQAAGSLAPLKRFAWIESVSAAGLCQELARHRGLPAEEAFVLGLLHDFGKVVATAFLERLLAAQPRVGSRPLDFWAALLERHPVAAGMAIAVEWNLPPLVAEVIALHHEGGGSPEARPLVDLVRTCDAVVALLATQPRSRSRTSPACRRSRRRSARWWRAPSPPSPSSSPPSRRPPPWRPRPRRRSWRRRSRRSRPGSAR
jgi:HD-like signal output (HDOD) protein